MITTDAELLHRFVENRSEAAFTELVQRYVMLVRTTALRRVGGDVHAADDVTQQVFVSLARKAFSLRAHASLAGWLHVSTYHATADFVRREQRRKQREATAHSMQLVDSSEAEQPEDVARLRPLLDDALVTLKPDDREAIALRFFAGRTFSEIGASLNLGEDAARKRVDRALGKLHTVLNRRGITSPLAALSGPLTAFGVGPAPAGFAAEVAGAALSKAAVSGFASAAAGLIWPLVATLALMGGTFAVVSAHRANTDAAASIMAQQAQVDTGIAALKNETQQLARLLTRTESAKTEWTTPASSIAPVILHSPPPQRTVVVSAQAALALDGEPVNLEAFLQELAKLRLERPNGESMLFVKANGAPFHGLSWVLDEARRVGITNIVVESDAVPEGAMNTWF